MRSKLVVMLAVGALALGACTDDSGPVGTANNANNGSNNATNNGSNNATNNGSNNQTNNGPNNATNNATNNASNNRTNNAVNEVPVATAVDPVTTDEDTAVSIILTGTDAEDDASELTIAITGEPAHGSLDTTSGSGPLTVVYTPDADYVGEDSLSFSVADSDGATSEAITVELSVTAVNDLPVGTAPQGLSTAEETPLTFTLTGADVEDAEGDLSVTIDENSGPAHGTLDLTGGDAPLEVTYTPELDYNGTDTFTFTLTDTESGISEPVTVEIEVTPVNDLPIATDVTTQTTAEDTAVLISLTGTDVEDAESELTIDVTDGPTNGTLDLTTGAGPLDVSYTPNANYAGPDAFTFTVTDSEGGVSEPITVDLTVTPVNDAPVGSDTTTTMAEDSSGSFTLTGTDVEDAEGALTVEITSGPSYGTIDLSSGAAPLSVTYVPGANFEGTETLSFTVTDSDGAVSTAATATITVTPVNDPPKATALGSTVTTTEDTPTTFTLTGTDIEDAEADLTVDVVSGPDHGSLDVTTGAAPLSVTYTPDADYDGLDSMTFKVTDSQTGTSAPVTVKFAITPVNDLPIATAVTTTTDEDTAVTLTLTGTDAEDAEGDLSVALATGPSNGTINLTGGAAPLSLIYTPAANFNGTETFSFKLTDTDGGSSAPASVTITVNAVNDAPIAENPGLITTAEDSPVSITLTGTDVEDGEGTLTVDVTSSPSHGTLNLASGSAPLTVTYAPVTNYNGPDAFTFTLTDADGATSDPITVDLSVTPVNDLPTATNTSATTPEDVPVTLTLTGTDLEDAEADLVVEVTSGPSQGTLDLTSGNAPLMATYTPDLNVSGNDVVTFTVTDTEAGTSATATATITITPVNDAPIGSDPGLISTVEDVPVAITLTGTDAESAEGSLTVNVLSSPSNGSLNLTAGTAPLTVTYAPLTDYYGYDTFTFEVTDPQGQVSDPVTIHIRVVVDCSDGPPNIDFDGDGFSICGGDCCESAAEGCSNPIAVNPGAYDVAGNGIDDDCDGAIDNEPVNACSATENFAVTGDDLAQAMDICQTTTLADDAWGLISAELLRVDGSTGVEAIQTAVMTQFGDVITPLAYDTMAAMSGDAARDAYDPGYNGDPIFAPGLPGPASFLAAHGGEFPTANDCSTGGSTAYDSVMLRLTLRVPSNAVGLEFDHRYFLEEHPNWRCTSWNDMFIALITSGGVGLPADGNIAFDGQGNYLANNTVELTHCSGCAAGDAELAGTSYSTNGATDWNTASAAVVPGEIVTLELHIFDVYDRSTGPLVLLDSFRWIIDASN